jgi:hypothetical protein
VESALRLAREVKIDEQDEQQSAQKREIVQQGEALMDRWRKLRRAKTLNKERRWSD